MAALSLPFAPPYGVIVSNDLLHHLHNPAMQWQAVVQWAGPGALVVERHAADAPLFSGATLPIPWQQPSCPRRWMLSWRRQG